MDHVYVSPENVPNTGTATAMQLTASQIAGFTITSENATTAYGGLPITELGDATFIASGTNIVITNLGSSGQDGLSFALPASQALVDLEFQEMDPSNSLPIGAYFQQQLIGTGNGITNGVLATVTYTKAGTSNYSISADFSPLGAPSYTVEAYLQGSQVGSQTGSANIVVGGGGGVKNTVHTSGVIWIYDYFVGSGWTPVLYGDWGAPTTFTLANGVTSVLVDHLYMSPDSGPYTYTVSSFQVTASQVPVMTMSGVSVGPLVLSTSHTGSNMTLQWVGTGVLQTIPSLSGTNWTTISGATSPYTIETGATSQFYRVSQPAP
jgi:hypothetical protein